MYSTRFGWYHSSPVWFLLSTTQFPASWSVKSEEPYGRVSGYEAFIHILVMLFEPMFSTIMAVGAPLLPGAMLFHVRTSGVMLTAVTDETVTVIEIVSLELTRVCAEAVSVRAMKKSPAMKSPSMVFFLNDMLLLAFIFSAASK